MTVQYVGYIERKSGKNIVLLEEVRKGKGLSPILVSGKFGNELPYLSNAKFEEFGLDKVPFGDFIEGEFNRYGNFEVKR